MRKFTFNYELSQGRTQDFIQRGTRQKSLIFINFQNGSAPQKKTQIIFQKRHFCSKRLEIISDFCVLRSILAKKKLLTHGSAHAIGLYIFLVGKQTTASGFRSIFVRFIRYHTFSQILMTSHFDFICVVCGSYPIAMLNHKRTLVISIVAL